MRHLKFMMMLILVLTVCYLSGCNSTEEDKYDLITKEDKKLILYLCECVESLAPYMEKMTSAKDSVEASMYLDSIMIRSKETSACIVGNKLLEAKAVTDEKYTKQMIAYIEHYYPKCLPFFLGVKSTNEIKK